MFKLNLIDKISFLLVTIGALNWGLIGLFNFNLVFKLFLGNDFLVRAIYILVGLAALNVIYLSSKVFKFTNKKFLK